MSQARSRNVRFEPPQAAVGQPAPTHRDDEVVLADGTRITIRRLNGLDEATVEECMEEAGFVNMDGPGRGTYLRCCACVTIIEVNGQLQVPPQTGAELKSRLSMRLGADWNVIVAAYARLIGAVPKDATFPDGRESAA